VPLLKNGEAVGQKREVIFRNECSRGGGAGDLSVRNSNTFVYWEGKCPSKYGASEEEKKGGKRAYLGIKDRSHRGKKGKRKPKLCEGSRGKQRYKEGKNIAGNKNKKADPTEGSMRGEKNIHIL